MKLEPGEVICPKCNGSGNQAKWKDLPDYKVYLPCPKCHGEGKLDWVENVVGSKKLPKKPTPPPPRILKH